MSKTNEQPLVTSAKLWRLCLRQTPFDIVEVYGAQPDLVQPGHIRCTSQAHAVALAAALRALRWNPETGDVHFDQAALAQARLDIAAEMAAEEAEAERRWSQPPIIGEAS